MSHKYKNGYLLGQNTSNESLHRRDEHVSWHSTLLVRTPGFCNHLEKICLIPVQEIEFLGLKINSVNLEISLTAEKNADSKNKMLKFTDRPRNIRINPCDWFVDINKLSSIASKITKSVLQMQQISFLKESHSYQKKIVLNHQSKTELRWWIINLDLSNGL